MRRFALILATLACTASPVVTAATAMAGQAVLVFAAASTRNAMDAAIQAYPGIDNPRVDIPRVDIRGVYAATSALSRQIIDGAPASIFLSANQAWTDQLEKADLLHERRNFLRTSLVLITPKSNPQPPSITAPGDIIPALSIAETQGVPAGIYARQALETLRLWPNLKDRLAQTANVRAALLLVERGETPLGLVYRTDALASPAVTEIWTVPASAHAPIVYPLALLAAPADNPQAAAFFAFLTSAAGRKIFAAHGFETD